MKVNHQLLINQWSSSTSCKNDGTMTTPSFRIRRFTLTFWWIIPDISTAAMGKRQIYKQRTQQLLLFNYTLTYNGRSLMNSPWWHFTSMVKPMGSLRAGSTIPIHYPSPVSRSAMTLPSDHGPVDLHRLRHGGEFSVNQCQGIKIMKCKPWKVLNLHCKPSPCWPWSYIAFFARPKFGQSGINSDKLTTCLS